MALRIEAIGALAVVAASIMVIWLPSHVPSQDGPAHLYMASVLRWLRDEPASLFDVYFSANWNRQPNLFAYGVLMGLLKYLPPAIAEKLLICLYLGGLPLAAAYAARVWGGRAALAALLAAPLGLSYTLFMGFYNHSLSALVFLIGLGVWARLGEKPTLAGHVVLGLAGLAAFYCHIFGAAALLFVCGVGEVWRFLQSGSQPLATRLRGGLVIAAFLLPTLILIIEYVFNRQSIAATLPTGDYLALARLVRLLSFSVVMALGQSDGIFAAGYGALFVLLAYQAIRHRGHRPLPRRSHVLVVVALAFIAFYMAVPLRVSGSGYVAERLLPFICLTFVLWLSALPMGGSFRRNLAVGLTLLGLGLAAQRGQQIVGIDQRMTPFYALGERLEPNRTLLALRLDSIEREDFAWTRDYRVDPLVHASLRIAAERRQVDLKLSQANGVEAPLRYRRAVNPFHGLPADLDRPADEIFWRHLNFRLGAPAPDLDFAEYEAKTGAHIDYLLLWGPFEAVQNDDRVRKFMTMVGARFELDHVANHEFRLYRRKAGLK